MSAQDLKRRLDERAVRDILGRLGVERFAAGGEGQWLVSAPYRVDRHPSLSVRQRDGVWNDFALGEGGSLLDLVVKCGHSFTDAVAMVESVVGLNGDKPAKQRTGRSPVVKQYDYTDEGGGLLYRVCRTEDKSFFPTQPNGKTGYGTRRVLYRLPEVVTSPFVILCEGERDADRVASLDLHDVAATASPGGSNGWRSEFAEMLRGKRVAILPDNDGPGQKYAATVAQSLQGIAASVQVVELPNLGPRLAKHGLDVSDWLDQGHTVEELLGAIEGAPEWLPGLPVEPPSEQPAAPRRFVFYTIKQLRDRPKQRFLIEDVLVAESVSELFGQPGALKSFVGLDQGLCVASGLLWQGRAVEQGPVVFVAGEGEGGLLKRATAWEIRHPGADAEQFWIMPGMVRALIQDDVPTFLRELPCQPSMVIIDTLSRSLAGGNENAPDDMGKFVDQCERIKRETGAHVLVLHHSTKDGGHSRGHSSFLGAVQTEIEASANDKLELVLRCRKQKDHEPFPPIYLQGRVVELDDEETSLVLESRRRPLSKTESDILAALQCQMPVALWRSAALAKGHSKRTFYRAKLALLTAGKVHQNGEICEPVP